MHDVSSVSALPELWAVEFSVFTENVTEMSLTQTQLILFAAKTMGVKSLCALTRVCLKQKIIFNILIKGFMQMRQFYFPLRQFFYPVWGCAKGIHGIFPKKKKEKEKFLCTCWDELIKLKWHHGQELLQYIGASWEVEIGSLSFLCQFMFFYIFLPLETV